MTIECGWLLNVGVLNMTINVSIEINSHSILIFNSNLFNICDVGDKSDKSDESDKSDKSDKSDGIW